MAKQTTVVVIGSLRVNYDFWFQCMSPKLILQLFGNDNVVNEDLFTDLCPVLIYQLDRKSCMKDDHKHHHGEGHDEGHFHDDHEHPPAAVSKDSSGFDLSSIPAKGNITAIARICLC